MRFMIIRRADKETEAGVRPSEELFAEMMRYNEELVKAGVMLQGEGLQPSSKGMRVKFSRGKPRVIDGPFTETKHGVAISTAAANVDIAPTILALKGVGGGESLDGRVLGEAMRDGVDEEQVLTETKVLRTEAGGYRAAVQVTDVGGRRYIDKGWRIR